MRSFFYKTVFVGVVGAAIVDAYSLYDSAPLIGVQNSYDLEYFARVNLGYDSNVNWAESDEDDSPFVNASVSVRYADMESVNKLSYSVKLGFTHYLDMDDYSGVAETRGDCSLSASMVHAFNPSNVLSSSLYVTYSPQPDYALGYVPTYCLGDMLNVSFANVYSHAVDSRWSLTASLSYSSISYTEAIERNDNRYYIEVGTGARYRESAIMTYKADIRFTRELREEGEDSDRYTATVGFQRALDPFSSCGGDFGVQLRAYDDDTFVSPYLNFSYRRKISEGFNAQIFVRYSDENAGTTTSYLATDQSYKTNKSWRVGSRLSYVLSPDVTYHLGANVILSDYADSSVANSDYSSSRYELTVGMDYAFTRDLRGNISGSYSVITRDYAERDSNDVSRWTVSSGLTYTF